MLGEVGTGPSVEGTLVHLERVRDGDGVFVRPRARRRRAKETRGAACGACVVDAPKIDRFSLHSGFVN